MRPETKTNTGGIALLLALSALPATAAASEEAFGNDAVIALAQANVGDAALIARIETLPCGYDVSTEQLARLRKANVSSAVLAAMIKRCPPAQERLVESAPPGIYLWRSEAERFRIEPAYVTAGGAGGNGSLLFPSKRKLSLSGASAPTRVPRLQATFYFQFAADEARRDGFGNAPLEGARNPSEFRLVRFDVEGAEREITIDRATALGSTAGVDPDAALPFSVSETGPHAYRVEVNGSLAAGQYAFVERLNGGTYRIYDFAVE